MCVWVVVVVVVVVVFCWFFFGGGGITIIYNISYNADFKLFVIKPTGCQ